jgi:hypothetical protein
MRKFNINKYSHTIKTPKVYSRTIGNSSFWMASWRVGGKVHNVHLGPSHSVKAEEAEAKALKLKTEDLKLFDNEVKKGILALKKYNPPNLDRLYDNITPEDVAFFGRLNWREQRAILKEIKEETKIPAHSEIILGETINFEEWTFPAVTFSEVIENHRKELGLKERQAELARFQGEDPNAHETCGGSISDEFYCKKCRISFRANCKVELKYCPMCGSKHIFNGTKFVDGEFRLKLKPLFEYS